MARFLQTKQTAILISSAFLISVCTTACGSPVSSDLQSETPQSQSSISETLPFSTEYAPGTLLYPRAIWSIWLSIRTVMVFPLQTAFTVLLRGKRAGLIFGTLTLLPDRKSTYAAVPTATITMKAVPPGFPIFLDDNWPFR